MDINKILYINLPLILVTTNPVRRMFLNAFVSPHNILDVYRLTIFASNCDNFEKSRNPLRSLIV